MTWKELRGRAIVFKINSLIWEAIELSQTLADELREEEYRRFPYLGTEAPDDLYDDNPEFKKLTTDLESAEELADGLLKWHAELDDMRLSFMRCIFGDDFKRYLQVIEEMKKNGEI